MLASSRNTLKRAQFKSCKAVTEATRQSNFTPILFSRCSQQRHASVASQRSSPVDPSSSSNLRNNPWSFTPDNSFKGTHLRSPLARYNLQLSKYAENGRLINALAVCKTMKEEGVAPDLFTYNHLMHACAENGMHQEAWTMFDDMLVMGISPDLTTFHHLIRANRFLETSAMWEVFEKMQAFGVAPTAVTFSFVLERYITAGNVEMALHYMAELDARRLVPELRIAQGVILLAARNAQPRLALDIAESFEETSVRRLDDEVWVNCLIASADALYVEGVRRCWDVVVTDLNITPDEGVCIAVLHTAARHGLPELAADVLRILKQMGATWREHHFAPVIEAFCTADKIKDAFTMLTIMRSSGVEPAPETAHPIFKAISTDIDTIDATWGMLDEIREEGKDIDVCALNVIVQASVGLGDLQRAVGTYKAYPDYGVKPTVETFNSLLQGCVDAGHRELGDRLMVEMKEAEVKPDAQTYEQLVLLCLTQTSYEDAFFYLEEMKAKGHLPTLLAYDSIVRRCISVGDTRYKLALDEMKECGYEISRGLQRFIDSGGNSS